MITPQPTEGLHGGRRAGSPAEWTASQLLKVTVGQEGWLTTGMEWEAGAGRKALSPDAKTTRAQRCPGSLAAPGTVPESPSKCSVTWPGAGTSCPFLLATIPHSLSSPDSRNSSSPQAEEEPKEDIVGDRVDGAPPSGRIGRVVRKEGTMRK